MVWYFLYPHICDSKVVESRRNTCIVRQKGKRKVRSLKLYPTKPKKPQPYKNERPTKDGQCHHYKEEGHWKRNCPVYLVELMKKKKTRGQNVASTSSGIYNIELIAFLKLPRVYTPVVGYSHLYTKQDLEEHRSEAGKSLLVRGQCRYGYVYSIKHKHEVFETFKVFKNEVENQLGKTIKAIRSDHGGEYISQEFKDCLKAYGIVQHLTPPYTPQHNGVSERRNRTLLNMVRSMMSLTTLPLSFWYYALESLLHAFSIWF
ncbi:retrotransposon protein, putative, ty1-copia subclass [Tanacetum coccineum]